MLEGIRGLMETMFDTVTMVADSGSLFDSIEKLKPDLVIVDLSLQHTGKTSIVHELASRCPGLKLIVLSLHDEQTVRKEIMATGAKGFVLKRSVGSDLIPAVEEVLQGRTYISPSAKVST
jgi:two-component system secretion response regulator SsrB